MLVRISFLSNSQGHTLEKMLSWVWLNFGNCISNQKVKPVMFMAWFHLLKKMNIVGYRSFITNHFHISFVFRWSTSRIRFLFLLYGWPDARREKRANGKGGWTPPPLEGTDLIRKSFLLGAVHKWRHHLRGRGGSGYPPKVMTSFSHDTMTRGRGVRSGYPHKVMTSFMNSPLWRVHIFVFVCVYDCCCWWLYLPVLLSLYISWQRSSSSVTSCIFHVLEEDLCECYLFWIKCLFKFYDVCICVCVCACVCEALFVQCLRKPDPVTVEVGVPQNQFLVY